jgi:hypothetical protein
MGENEFDCVDDDARHEGGGLMMEGSGVLLLLLRIQ